MYLGFYILTIQTFLPNFPDLFVMINLRLLTSEVAEQYAVFM